MMSSTLGLVIIVFAIGDYLVKLFTRRAASSTRGTDGYVLAGLLLTSASVSILGAAIWRLVLAALLAASWFILTRTERRLRARPGMPPAVGAPLPDFTALPVGEGDDAPSGRAAVVGRAPAALILLRGTWCPFCATQLADAIAQERALAEAGLHVVFLTLGDPVTLAPLATRLAAGEQGMLHLLADPTGEALDALGRLGRNAVPWYDRSFLGAPPDTALPAAFLVDAAGKVVWSRLARTIDDRAPTRELLTALHA